MTRVLRICMVLHLTLAGALLPAFAQPATAEASPGDEAVRLRLDAIRDDLVELRFEQALAAIEALLGQPGLSEAERGEALVLRSQTHVAFGDLAAAEADFGEILRLRPGYVPDTSMTPRKAMERFEKVRRQLIGELVLELDPQDASVTVDGRPVVQGTQTPLPLVAGEHVVVAEREGFDPQRTSVVVEADQQNVLELRLVPNARTVVLLTEPDGVDVHVDGIKVGRTERPPASVWGAARKPAELRLENLPLGEHVFELSKPCFRTERRRELLTVDLLHRTPMVFPVTRLVAVHATMVLRGGPPAAEVFVDGGGVGRLPSDPLELCPGSHRLEVRQGGRIVWSSGESLVEGEDRVIEILPRPNVVILGAEDWPRSLAHLEGRFNETRGWPLPRRSDPTTASGWSDIELPPDTDLALARRSPGPRRGTTEWYLYSPILRHVHRLEAPPAEVRRPSWSGTAWGLFPVDSDVGGPAFVAEVAEGGPGALAGLRPTDRIVSLGGVNVEGAAQVRRILDVASLAAPLDVSWVRTDGETRQGQLRGSATARLEVGPFEPVEASIRAAWAIVDAICDTEHANAALANLALVLSQFDRHEMAVATWRRVGFPERAGIGRGTVQYYLGCELEQLGREAEAIEAQRAASASDGTTVDDDGPRVAPAARDRLVDLGVSVAGPTAP